MNLYLWRPRGGSIEVLSQRFFHFQLNFFYLLGESGVEVNDFILQIDTILGLLTEGNKCLVIINNIFTFILFKATLGVLFRDVWIIGFHIRP